jgi:hypothetical protein
MGVFVLNRPVVTMGAAKRHTLTNMAVLKFNFTQLKKSHQSLWFLIDMVMLLLLVINLFLILLDSLYRLALFAEVVNRLVPPAQPVLEALNAHFLAIDVAFVSIFLAEFLVRWWVAVQTKTYRRWFFYPFIHFYDFLGCIPLGSFRMLRFLRVFSIVYRLQQYQIIDLRESALFRFVVFYYEVLLEELSDRVVVKVISGVQDDLKAGSDFGQQVVNQLILPRLTRLEGATKSLARRMSKAMRKDADHPVSHSLRTSVLDAMQGNEDLKRLGMLPMFGSVINSHLEDLVADIVVDTIASLVEQSHTFLKLETLRSMVDDKDHSGVELNHEVVALIQDILELVKEQMGQKAWKRKLDQVPAN